MIYYNTNVSSLLKNIIRLQTIYCIFVVWTFGTHIGYSHYEYVRASLNISSIFINLTLTQCINAS